MAPNKSPLQAPSKRTGSRSRVGCARCRGRRQKCDEKQPQCGRCHLAGADCSYMMNIRWGGRDFHRSRFGDCRVRRVELGLGNFIYSAEKAEKLSRPDLCYHTDKDYQTRLLGMDMNQFPDVAPDQRDLIQYFTCQASAMISCHPQMQHEACNVLMSLSSTSTALLYSLLAFAAGHQASRTTDEVKKRHLRRQMIQLETKSVRDLQGEISLQLRSGVPLMASSLMLCLCSLCHEGDDYISWRAHLRGAKAAFSIISATEFVGNESQIEYLTKRYQLLEAIAMLTAKGFEALEPKDGQQPSSQAFLNDHVACYNEVLDMFRHIGAVAFDRRKLDVTPQNSILSPSDFELEGQNMESALLQMIHRDNDLPPRFLPRVQEMLNADQVGEFTICNQIYEYTALLHIRTQIRRLPLDTPEVMETIKTIIHLSKQVEPRSGLSPSLGINTALSAAGMYALGDIRQEIRELLLLHYESTRNQSMMVALQNMERHWLEMSSFQRIASDSINQDFLAY